MEAKTDYCCRTTEDRIKQSEIVTELYLHLSPDKTEGKLYSESHLCVSVLLQAVCACVYLFLRVSASMRVCVCVPV